MAERRRLGNNVILRVGVVPETLMILHLHSDTCGMPLTTPQQCSLHSAVERTSLAYFLIPTQEPCPAKLGEPAITFHYLFGPARQTHCHIKTNKSLHKN